MCLRPLPVARSLFPVPSSDRAAYIGGLLEERDLAQVLALNRRRQRAPQPRSRPPSIRVVFSAGKWRCTTPIPIIKNEELILLRAEAFAALDELLYNKLYPLMFEGAHRWIDARHYGRLADLPIDRPSPEPPTPADVVFSTLPIPTDETLPRQ
jgi:hypothetical protein